MEKRDGRRETGDGGHVKTLRQRSQPLPPFDKLRDRLRLAKRQDGAQRQTAKRKDPQTFRPLDLQTFRLSTLQTFDFTDFRLYGLYTMKTVILADGTYPSHEVPLKHIREADMIVCCDGAAEKLDRHGLVPDAIVGDLDSISDSLKEKYSDRLFPDDDQDTNDLTKAVKWCLEKGIAEVVIVGATGMREDHTLGNISLLADYSSMINAVMLTDSGSFRVYYGSVTIASRPGQQVSLFSIDPSLTITSSGLRYPLAKLQLHSWWRGTLNEATGATFSLELNMGQVILFLKYPEL